MDTFHTWVLIRMLFFLGMIGVLAIEVVFFAPRDKHRSSRTLQDQQGRSSELQDDLQCSPSHLADRGQAEANDPDISPTGAQRRAA